MAHDLTPKFSENRAPFSVVERLKNLVFPMALRFGGENGIRTHGRFLPTHDFQSCVKSARTLKFRKPLRPKGYGVCKNLTI